MRDAHCSRKIAIETLLCYCGNTTVSIRYLESRSTRERQLPNHYTNEHVLIYYYHILLVMNQSHCTRGQAIQSLVNNNNTVNAIMELTS